MQVAALIQGGETQPKDKRLEFKPEPTPEEKRVADLDAKKARVRQQAEMMSGMLGVGE